MRLPILTDIRTHRWAGSRGLKTACAHLGAVSQANERVRQKRVNARAESLAKR